MTKRPDNVIQFDPKRRKKPPEKPRAPKPRKPAPRLNMGYVVVVLVCFGFLLSNFLQRQPKSSSLKFEVAGSTAYGTGATDTSSLAYMSRFLDDNPQVNRLVFRNMPGTSDGNTNLQIAQLIRSRGLSIHLERSSYIASGAVDLFIGGANRTMDCGARIGVHGWRVAPGRTAETMATDPFAAGHQSFLREMGIDPAFYDFTNTAAPAHDIHIMSAQEIESWGLLTTPANCP